MGWSKQNWEHHQGRFDSCFVPRHTHHTGPIMGHDLGFGTGGLWATNTLFSCLCTIEDEYSFVPRWKPKFISRLADEDRCHLNGMAMDQGRPTFVTALSETDTPAGWRPNKVSMVVLSTSALVRLPHAVCVCPLAASLPESLWVLNSGYGNLSTVDVSTGKLTAVETSAGLHSRVGLSWPVCFRRTLSHTRN